ncbi:MAG: hypothetical protein ACPLPW_08160, partial [bacterium]
MIEPNPNQTGGSFYESTIPKTDQGVGWKRGRGQVGAIEDLQVPRVRTGDFHPCFLEPHERHL